MGYPPPLTVTLHLLPSHTAHQTVIQYLVIEMHSLCGVGRGRCDYLRVVVTAGRGVRGEGCGRGGDGRRRRGSGWGVRARAVPLKLLCGGHGGGEKMDRGTISSGTSGGRV